MITITNEQILDNMTDGITVQDIDFNVIYQNRMMREAFGDCIGKKCYACYERRDKICEDCGIQKAIQSRKPIVVLRTGIMFSGRVTSWENVCVPIFDNDGKVIAGMEICREITSRVSLETEVRERNVQLGQLNDQLERRTAELQEALKQREAMARNLEQEIVQRSRLEEELHQSQKLEAVGQLAAGIAHEINTPTQYVGDNIRFIKDSFESIIKIFSIYEQLLAAVKKGNVSTELIAKLEDAHEKNDLGFFFEQIPAAVKDSLEGINSISKIVLAMKEFSHPGGKEKSPADLNKAIVTTTTVARNEWKLVADLELQLDPTLPLVPCYLGEFNQCILNLIVNATHAISDVVRQKPGTRGKITICTRPDGDHAEVRVEDTGNGIPETVRNRIFEPFFTTKEVGKGTGQGLAIVYNTIVKKHGGTVNFETETGKGTTFILRLPINPTCPLRDVLHCNSGK